MRKTLATKRVKAGFTTMAAAAKAAGMTRQEWANYERSDVQGTLEKWNKIKEALGLSSSEMWDIMNDKDGRNENTDFAAYADGLKEDWQEEGFIDFADVRLQFLFYSAERADIEVGKYPLFRIFEESAMANDKESIFLVPNYRLKQISSFYADIISKTPAKFSKVTGFGDVLRANTVEKINQLETKYKEFILSLAESNKTAFDMYKKRAEELLESGLGIELEISMQEEELEILNHKVIHKNELTLKKFAEDILKTE